MLTTLTFFRSPLVSAVELNHDLALIRTWAHLWKINFNPDPTKQSEEIIFSHERKSSDHPPIYFNNTEVKRVRDHKHLGLVLDSKFMFTKHINGNLVIVPQTSSKQYFVATDRYLKIFFPDSVIAWNGISPVLRGAETLSIFKKHILKVIRAVKKSLFNIHHPNGIR